VGVCHTSSQRRCSARWCGPLERASPLRPHALPLQTASPLWSGWWPHADLAVLDHQWHPRSPTPAPSPPWRSSTRRSMPQVRCVEDLRAGRAHEWEAPSFSSAGEARRASWARVCRGPARAWGSPARSVLNFWRSSAGGRGTEAAAPWEGTEEGALPRRVHGDHPRGRGPSLAAVLGRSRWGPTSASGDCRTYSNTAFQGGWDGMRRATRFPPIAFSACACSGKRI
jgi:hypothetical protein